MRNGLITIGYDNSDLNQQPNKYTISQYSSLIGSHTNYIIPQIYKDLVHYLEEPIDYDTLYSLIGALITEPNITRDKLLQLGIIDQTIANQLQIEPVPSLASTYILLGQAVLSKLPAREIDFYQDTPEFLTESSLMFSTK